MVATLTVAASSAACARVRGIVTTAAAWIRNRAHLNLAPVAFNPALTKNQVLAAVSATGFIKQRRRPMPNIGPMELVIVLVIALIVLGPKRLPDAGKSLGRGLREFKGAISGRDDDAKDDLGLEPAATPQRRDPVA